MVTVLVFCREGQSVFPVLLLWKRIQTLVACWDMCYWFAKFRYAGHLEFWETVLLVICIVEHAPHVGWLFDCFDGFMFET